MSTASAGLVCPDCGGRVVHKDVHIDEDTVLDVEDCLDCDYDTVPEWL